MSALGKMETAETVDHRMDLEVGVANALEQHVTRYVAPTPKVSSRRLAYESKRPHWLRELIAEAMGVFFYVYPGVASTAALTLTGGNAAFGSIFQIGWAFGIGIAFAIIICAPVSGGHFNPAITFCFALFKGFPWRKVPQYIFAQIFGSFMAGLFVMGQYRNEIIALGAKYKAAGITSMNFNGGPGGIFCAFPATDQTNLGYLFMNEFFAASFCALVIWAVLDPANPFISPVAAPFIIGMSYATMAWGFAEGTVALNTARDLGTRIVAAIFYGGDAFSYHHYSWIGILVSIPASLFAATLYELVLTDSVVHIAKGHAVHSKGREGLAQHFSRTGALGRTTDSDE